MAVPRPGVSGGAGDPGARPGPPGPRPVEDMGHGPKPDENFPKAQAIKDATMAYFILKNLQDGNLFFHMNGSYHSDNFEGILWYLMQAKPELTIKTITNVSQNEIEQLEDQYNGKASYVLVVPATMTKTR